MLRIFRINDPYRLILVFLIVLAYKFPVMLNAHLITIPELKYFVIGERLATGATLYKDLWENIAPFSAWFYMFLHMVFGKSLIAYHIISLLLLVIQAGLFNVILIRRKVYNENNYVPALFYGVFGLLFFDVTALSPQLLGLTFILFSFDSLFSHLELRRKNDINLLNLGIYIGVASMFYFPYLIYFISIALGLLLFTNTIRRRYFLMFFGSFFVLLLLWVYFFIINAHDQFINCLIQPLINLDYRIYFTINSILFLVSIPLFYLIISIFKVFLSHGFTNNQVRIQSLFFLFLIFQLASWLLWSQKSGSSLIIFVPIFSFFYTHFFLLIRKRIWRMVHFYLLTAYFLLVYLVPFVGKNIMKDKIFMDRLLVNQDKILPDENQKVLVIGEELSYYYQNSLATPYLNWSISKELLLNVNDYQNIIIINKAFDGESPDVVIDEKNIFPEIMLRIPDIRNRYQEKSPNLFVKVSN